MTAAETGKRQEKIFEQRRAALAPEDPGADEAFLASLRIVAKDPASGTLHLPGRPLDGHEKELALAGRLQQSLRGAVVLREDAVAELEAARVAKERRAAGVKAERAQREADRLQREAARWRP